MFRSNRSFVRLTLTSAVALLAACSAADQAVAPAVQHAARPAGAPSLDVIMNSVAVDSLSAEITVTPSGGMFVLGSNAVFFPDHSICDPATSTYGPGHWDDACEPLDAPIELHAEVRHNEAGQSWVDFTPAVRFVPSNDPNQAVWMMMKPGEDITLDNFGQFGMEWMPNGSPDVTVNEAADDADLKSYVDLERDVVFRRVKHFSGYIIFSSRSVERDAVSDIIPLW